MAAIGVSIEPKEEDRAEATVRVLAELIEHNGTKDITEIIVQKEMKIIRAERLREKVENFVGREVAQWDSNTMEI